MVGLGLGAAMRFSIITPVLNGMPYLPDAVASVDAQRRDADVDVEHIILDGGSRDGSREWLAAHATHATLVFEPDEGQTDALRRGFARARPGVWGWLNADDLLEPHALAHVADVFSAQPDAVAVSGGCLIIDQEGAIQGAIPTLTGASLEELLGQETNLAQQATFFRSDAYEAVGGVDPRWDLAMDVDLWLRLARQGRIVLARKQLLARMRVHPGAKTSRMLRASALEDLRIRLMNGMKPWTGVARNLAVRCVLPGPETNLTDFIQRRSWHALKRLVGKPPR